MKKFLSIKISKVLALGIIIGITSLTTINTFASTKYYKFEQRNTNSLNKIKLEEYLVDENTGLVFQVIKNTKNPHRFGEKSVKFVGSITNNINNLDIKDKIPYKSNFYFDSKQKDSFIYLINDKDSKLIVQEFDSNPKNFEFNLINKKLTKTENDMEIDEISIEAQKNIQEILRSKFIEIK